MRAAYENLVAEGYTGRLPASFGRYDVVSMVAAGMDNAAIARELVLSVRTVESHVASVYSKLGLSGRTARAAATAYALANGLG